MALEKLMKKGRKRKEGNENQRRTEAEFSIMGKINP
jgi:hypothetical protein